jgi:hypothetical protein
VKSLTAPMPFEVVTGYGSKRSVIHTHSIAEADRVYLAQLKSGSTPAIYLGSLLVRGQQ